MPLRFMMMVHLLLAALAGMLSVSSRAAAAPGDLDPTFGVGGTVTTPIGPVSDEARAVALQPDGKLVAVGYAFNGTDDDFALVRYNADGTVDGTFGSGGKVTTPIGPRDEQALAAALQPDGKLVAVGYTFNGTSYDFALVRYNADGTLDGTFGSGGIVTTAVFGFSDELAQAVVLQPDGKLVAAGRTLGDFALVRYNTDGTLDGTFGSGGIVTTDLSGGSFDTATAVTLQPDGKLVAVGATGTSYDFALVRYNADGTLDGTFGSSGKVITSIGAGNDLPLGVALQPDGKLVAVGSTSNGTNDDFALVRYNADGTLDGTFGSGGIVTTPIGPGFDDAYAVALEAGGKLVAVGGAQTTGSDDDFALVRYNADGTLDGTFGSGGIVTTNFAGSHDDAYAVVLQPDGKLVAVGAAVVGSARDFALARYEGSAVAPTPTVTATMTTTATPTPTITVTPSPTPTTTPFCGDGALDIGEQCDDANNANGDGCSATCIFEQFIPGKGAPAKDCIIEWAIINPNNTPYLDNKGVPNFKQTCTDGDSSCDADGIVNDECHFRLAVCLNNSDPNLSACVPYPPIVGYQMLKPRIDSSRPQDAANAAALLGAFARLSTAMPGGTHGSVLSFSPSLQPTSPDNCSTPVEFIVKLTAPRALETIKGKATTDARPGHGPGDKTVDTDKLKLTCTRP